ncbi:heme-binding domain-containing protein [bacterium]|nr:heme-binding domain-containing protein [bacterium]
MKLGKKIPIALLLVLVAMQFYRPEKNQAQGNHTKVFLDQTNPPDEVKSILQQTCYDCHSNNTNYPWYNNIAPVSYWLADHVKDGKKHLNFSDWENYSAKKAAHKLEETAEMVGEGSMPLKEYTWTHETARLTEEQRKAVVAWAEQTKSLYELGPQPE